jgi:microcystin-dependent protein
MEDIIGEVRVFVGSDVPKNWKLCDGRLLSIEKYPTMYSLIGTKFGGDGRVTFALPNFAGRFPTHGQYNSNSSLLGGKEEVTLSSDQMPQHSHEAKFKASKMEDANQSTLDKGVFGILNPSYNPTNTINAYTRSLSEPYVTLNSSSIKSTKTGTGKPFDVRNPYFAVNFIICVKGIYTD